MNRREILAAVFAAVGSLFGCRPQINSGAWIRIDVPPDDAGLWELRRHLRNAQHIRRLLANPLIVPRGIVCVFASGKRRSFDNAKMGIIDILADALTKLCRVTGAKTKKEMEAVYRECFYDSLEMTHLPRTL